MGSGLYLLTVSNKNVFGDLKQMKMSAWQIFEVRNQEETNSTVDKDSEEDWGLFTGQANLD